MELNAAVRLPLTLDPASVGRLRQDLDAALQSESPVVTLVGHDEATFCAGMSLDAMIGGSGDVQHFVDLLAALHTSPKPLLAVVNGAAIGGGLGLACSCDWVVATTRSTFGLPELLWGLVPAIIWPVITARMPVNLARRWTVSAHARDAAEAAQAGIVDDLTSLDRLDATVRRAHRMLQRLDPVALTRLRAWARESAQLPLPDALARGAAITTSLAATPAARGRWDAYQNGAAPWSA